MQTSVIGFPRIGTLRELKFASEKYFKKEIKAEEILQTGKDLRKIHWNTQKEAGIDFISCNDFSYYDMMLDTAVLFGIVPKRYRELNLSDLDTYYAMARGYQGASGDVKALAMKKWFNTNYHYIVPEIEDETQIRLSGNKPFEEYNEAKALGIETKPVVIGAYTLLKLCRYTGEKTINDYTDAVITAYQDLLKKCEENKIAWIQFDEPALVQDMSVEDIALFHKIYDAVLSVKKESHILLQTYFGDVRDIYADLIKMPFDGIGLDFIEGKETDFLVETYGFPTDKWLFAGLMNGKNIWKNHYEKTLQVLGKLQEKGIKSVLSTSCSLLHVPYTTKHETKLSAKYLSYFAFAEEKLGELAELKELAESANYQLETTYQKNKKLFAEGRDCFSEQVHKRLSLVTKKDYTREPKRSERQKLQKKELGLPEFPTTTIGSFPQTKDVKANRSAYRQGKISEEEYKAFNKKKIAECVRWQEEIGLDVLVHGEYERNDMVEYFGEALGGFLFTEKAWVQSYGTRCVKPPIIWGDVYREKPITVEWSVYAQSLTKKIMKGMLTGPVTILNWSFPREDISIKESISQIALAIRDEVLDLEKNGIKIIQIDEAALREKLPLRKSDWQKEYLDFAIPAFRLTHSGVKAGTQIHTHMCYSEFTDIIPAIDDMDADVITFEASRSDFQILDALKEHHFETEVGPGVYDIHSPRVPSVAEIVAALRVMLTKIDKEKLWVNPDCGLKTRDIPETEESLKNLVAAARVIRSEG
ncbi:MAG: 5-methyltetrahydropteroyltriglutamate--homocysteine S-methyltransferase [Roseburia sp.]|uniref:5-methyltetrahydropteroyltriglutamate-- homocysteine S-methyltransferase n=1 Tax=Roseburia sp. 831b TaxID=1261635 RepID=UPI0009518895|nr:5-methyltetrahydropteroyltriglutamate--homocysteine S-methyltransferase [Roseburia sp. 831b]MCI5919215.1 5-methyltetrahydropteroyltriglutamate--homocysteine S-methyltransferase [Roseburia sp.]MDY5884180.1 5-methyltetrahydropteroyltriglutamate--homocysteine S-methyltransferase [Roseburia sp.]WVK74511.1 5-methyltetrahydropteroyltriglutamate--homocysteine S-methyltransferase [Roseburia sp. 831b]